MKRAEALRRLRDIGTLRGDIDLNDCLQPGDVGQPIALAALRLAQHCWQQDSALPALLAPSEFIQPLP